MKGIFFALLMLIGTNLSANDLHVYAPKPLKGALTEMSELFERKNPDWKVKLRIGKSGELSRLISQQTAADVFLLNDDKAIRTLREKKQIQNVRKFLADDLVIIGSATSKLEITEPSKLVYPELKAVALFGDKHPLGKAARAYLEKVKILESVIVKVAPKKNTKEVIQSIVGGEVDWAIVYASDISHAKGIKVLWKIPEKDVTPEIYYIGKVTNSQHPQGVKLFMETLTSTIAEKIYENSGFRLLKE